MKVGDLVVILSNGHNNGIHHYLEVGEHGRIHELYNDRAAITSFNSPHRMNILSQIVSFADFQVIKKELNNKEAVFLLNKD